MSKFTDALKTQWRDSANFLLGVWLVLSPWIVQFREIELAFWNALALGVIIAIAALSALVRFQEWEEWVSLLFGAWLVISPWVLGFAATTGAMWNHLVVGLLVAGMAIWSIWDARHRPIETT